VRTRLSIWITLLAVGLTESARAQSTDVTIHTHTVHVEMGEGLARVTEELVLTSLTQGLRMSLPISDRGALTGLEVCEGRRCMPGITVAETSEVFDAARFAYREEGAPALAMASETRGIISLHVAGSDVGTPRVRITWTAPTETLSGQERLVLPERRDGVDFVLTSATLEGLALQGDPLERHLPAHTRGVLSGVISSHAPELISGVVGAGENAQTWVRFSPTAAPLEVRDVVILLDASPGMWPRETEALRVLSLVLHALPDGSEAHLIALARHTRELAAGPVESLRAQAFSLPRDLGPSTSVVASEEALVALDAALHSPRIVWIGDGSMDWSTADQEALARLRTRGLEVISLGHGDAPDRMGRSTRVDVTVDAEQAALRIRGALSPSVQRRVGGHTLEARPGESAFLALSGAHPSGEASHLAASEMAPHLRRALGLVDPDEGAAFITLDARDRLAARKVARGRMAVFHSGGGMSPAEVRRVPRICSCGDPYEHGRISRTTIERIVRRTVLPRARECFARERAGRASWEGRATLVLGIEGTEVGFADVETESPALRACILGAVDHLVLPPVAEPTGSRVVIHYPLVSPARTSESHDAAPLTGATSTALDAIFGSEPSVPPRTPERTSAPPP
jgi:hypothetical protein